MDQAEDSPLPPPPDSTPVPPPLPPSDSDRAGSEPSPWGFWPTLALGSGIALVSLVVETVVILAVAAFPAARGDAIDLETLASQGWVLSLATLITLPVVVGMCLWLAALRPGWRATVYLGWVPCRGKSIGLGLLAAALLGVSYDWLSQALGRPVVPDFMVEAYATAGFVPLLWLAVVFAAPLSEELFFRGFLFRGWASSFLGGWGTVLLTSVLWAVIHFQYDLYDVVAVFLMGLLLGGFRLQTQSLWPPLIMHAAFNLVATIQVAALPR